MKREKIACECKRVTYGQIYDAVAAGARTFEEVQRATQCGLGCKHCVELIEGLIKDFLEELQ